MLATDLSRQKDFSISNVVNIFLPYTNRITCNLAKHIYKNDVIGNMIGMATLMVLKNIYKYLKVCRGLSFFLRDETA